MRSLSSRRPPTPRRPHPWRGPAPIPGRRWITVAAFSAALSLGPLLAGCGADDTATAGPDEAVYLHPAAARGPDPYTVSTVRALSAPAPQPPVPKGVAAGAPARGQTLRTLSGATPGLYAGTRSIGSCDAERQLALLGRDRGAEAAFARSSGVSRAGLPSFVRSLTPVVLRADTRVTGHGYRAGGAATAHQAVLQAGTPVLVDRHGMPRVRCAGGNPLGPPVAVKGAVVHAGRAWAGYEAGRAVVIGPAERTIGRLLIVDLADSTWIDRETGTDGELDRLPDVLPPAVEDAGFSYPPVPAAPAAEPSRGGGGADPAGTLPPEGAVPAAPPEEAVPPDGVVSSAEIILPDEIIPPDLPAVPPAAEPDAHLPLPDPEPLLPADDAADPGLLTG
ncbi:DUF6777 domain-containing protein [Streptomyces sp. CAU 1734]|uniref:DUF6777 domain-containing protein n=1 Tax=Streptomyces sp. CAU 1734 TaxID=3140360 RepID=UPI0032602127